MSILAHRVTVFFALALAAALSTIGATRAEAATVTVSGFANCWGMLGYPTPAEPATQVRITIPGASVAVGVNAIGFYSANVPNVPSGGASATAYVSCLSGAGPWNLPFHLATSSMSLDLTNPTPVDFAVYLDDPRNLSPINLHPRHPSRPLSVQIYNQSNALVGTRKVTATQFYANGAPTDEYTGTIYLGHISGVRWFKVWLDYTLHHQMQSFINVPSIPGPWHYSLDMRNDDVKTLIVGDINQDNRITTSSTNRTDDYNLLLNCYSDLLPPRGPCSPQQKRAADLNDDGSVNGLDYNLFLKIIGVSP